MKSRVKTNKERRAERLYIETAKWESEERGQEMKKKKVKK